MEIEMEIEMATVTVTEHAGNRKCGVSCRTYTHATLEMGNVCAVK
jgi:hypothetical protein